MPPLGKPKAPLLVASFFDEKERRAIGRTQELENELHAYQVRVQRIIESVVELDAVTFQDAQTLAMAGIGAPVEREAFFIKVAEVWMV